MRNQFQSAMDTLETSTVRKAANFGFVLIWLALAILLVLFHVIFEIGKIVIATKIISSPPAKKIDRRNH